MEDAGYAVGARALELLCHREKVQIFGIYITKIVSWIIFPIVAFKEIYLHFLFSAVSTLVCGLEVKD